MSEFNCLSETIFCHSGVFENNDVLDIIENFRVLAYADILKLYIRVSSTDDYRLFQQDLDRLQGWCREKKYDFNEKYDFRFASNPYPKRRNARLMDFYQLPAMAKMTHIQF
jgi:hypothetical protein